jgi:urea transporter
MFAFKGYGQVIFQGSFVAGLLFFIAVFISSPNSALYGLAGAIISAIIAFNLSVPINDISIGLYSYNAVLCSITFAGTQIKDGFWVLLSVVLSIAVSVLLAKYNIIALTFPFVLASCITLLIKNKSNFLAKSKVESR